MLDKNKKRIDLLVFEKGLTESREKAMRLILARRVKADGKFIVKPGTKISEDSKIELDKINKYVGKGALKIESVYNKFRLAFKDKVIADVGASTGGFTDFVLEKGAKKVYAVDVGYGQLAFSLRGNKKVINMERTDIRDIEKFPNVINIFLIDVSFVSLKRILPKIKEIVKNQQKKSDIIALVKPQFEVGKEVASKFKGVIRDQKIQIQTVKDIERFAKGEGFAVISRIKSGLRGEKGNQEYFLYLRYPGKVMVFGTFDLFHKGHEYFLEKAKELGKLKVVIPSDERVSELKGKKPIHSTDERIKNIKKLGFEVEIEKEDPFLNILNSQVDIVVLGYDQNWEKEIKREIKKTGYLVKIVKIKKAYQSHILKTNILRKRID